MTAGGLLGALTMASPGQAQPTPDITGTYCLTGVHEVGSCFRFSADQTFEYFLSYGAYDETSEGRWRLDGADYVLDSGAYDRQPSFVFKGRRPGRGDVYEIIVENAAGRGIPGVDVRATCNGSVSEGYTQQDGYPTRCSNAPSAITLGIRMVGLAHQPVTFAGQSGDGKALVFVFEPGDLGKKSFAGTRLKREADGTFRMVYQSAAVRDLDRKSFLYRRDQ